MTRLFFIVAVLASILATSSCSKDKPVACFTTKTQLDLGESAELTNCSVSASSYQWDFGNGNTSTEAVPNLSYDEEGVYQVKLTAGNKGKTSELIRTISVALNDLTAGSDGSYQGTFTETYSDSSALDKSYPATASIEILGTKDIKVTFPRGTYEANVSGESGVNFSFSAVSNLNPARVQNLTMASGSFQHSSGAFSFSLEGTDPQFGDIPWKIDFSGTKN